MRKSERRRGQKRVDIHVRTALAPFPIFIADKGQKGSHTTSKLMIWAEKLLTLHTPREKMNNQMKKKIITFLNMFLLKYDSHHFQFSAK